MNKLNLSKRSYLLLWLNSVTSTLMVQYMMSIGDFFIPSLFVWGFSGIGYYYGYRYASTGKEVPKKAYLAVLSIYAGVLAVPELLRPFWGNIHLILFPYTCGRLLMFRAVWLKKRTEAYLHLLVYLIIVFGCMAHNRADFTLFVFLPLHIMVLLIALYSLYQDTQNDTASTFSFIPLTQSFILIIFISLSLFALLPATKLWHFELIPEKTGKLTLSNTGDPIAQIITYLSTQKMTANPDSNLGKMLTQKMQTAYDHAQKTEIDLKLLLFIIISIMFIIFLWLKRRRVFIVLQTALVDPIRVFIISKKKYIKKSDVFFLYRAFERLWHYEGLARHPFMTPTELLSNIATDYKVMIKPSTILVETFQSVRYGEKNITDLRSTINAYLLIRVFIDPKILWLFRK